MKYKVLEKGKNVTISTEGEHAVCLSVRNPVAFNADYWEASESRVQMVLSREDFKVIAQAYGKLGDD